MSAARTERYGLNDDQEQAYDSLTSGERKAFRSAMRSGDDLTPLEIAVYNRVMQAGDDRATG